MITVAGQGILHVLLDSNNLLVAACKHGMLRPHDVMVHRAFMRMPWQTCCRTSLMDPYSCRNL